MVYNNVNYRFTNTQKVQDKAPEWMDTFFKDVNKPQQKISLASLTDTPRKVHFCEKCHKKLEDNEVAVCSSCCQ